MTSFTTSLRLGIDIEELYIHFGEGTMMAGGGLEPEAYESAERKAQRVRDTLLDMNSPFGLVQRLEAAASNLHRVGDPLPEGFDAPAWSEALITTGRELDAVMEEIRNHLGEEEGERYDVGVMVARLHLCLRALNAISDEPRRVQRQRFFKKRRELYRNELLRVIPILTLMLSSVQGQNAYEFVDAEIRRSLGGLGQQLVRSDGTGSDMWCRATKAAADDVLSALGFL